MIGQIIIAITGVVAIFLTQSQNPNIQKHACLVGMAGQPFWIMAALETEQWGIFFLSVFYTVAWGQGIYNFWLRFDKAN